MQNAGHLATDLEKAPSRGSTNGKFCLQKESALGTSWQILKIMSAPRKVMKSRKLIHLLNNLFFCPSCSLWRTQSLGQRAIGINRASTFASSTAVNATKNIPPRNLPLLKSLGEVKKKAYGQVNLSRLQLAIQSLESERPTTRVAVLSLNAPDTAKRLVRLLLADALEPEGEWEKQLLSENNDCSEGLIIRFGETANPSLRQARQPLPTLLVPSALLQQNNIEILVSSLTAPVAGNGAPSASTDAFLSPTIRTPSSASGRQSTINQPVHRSLLIANGLGELIQATEVLASARFNTSSERQMVAVALCLEGAKLPGEEDSVTLFDVSKAEAGLDAIRSSLTKATTYEHNWLDSGILSLSSWLSQASTTDSTFLSAPVKNLIVSVLDIASANLSLQETEAIHATQLSSMHPNTFSNLEAAITDFSHQSHKELQSGLATAWSSRNWRKLAWYKLFWRIDDVEMIVTDLVSKSWLPRTEKAVYEISGRLLQAGVPPTVLATERGLIDQTPAEEAENSSKLPVIATNQTLATADVNTGVIPFSAVRSIRLLENTPPKSIGPTTMPEPNPVPMPLTTLITSARSSIIAKSITTLTATAQQLVLRTLSISGLSAGLSGLFYLSVTPGSIYESATIVALGTVFALRRMQRDWRKECRELENGFLEKAREILRDVEVGLRTGVDEGAKVREDSVDVKARKEAADAIESARTELKKLAG